jgi:hypothetical protein
MHQDSRRFFGTQKKSTSTSDFRVPPILPRKLLTHSPFFHLPGVIRSFAKVSHHQFGTGEECVEGPRPPVSFGGIDSASYPLVMTNMAIENGHL